MNKTLATYMTIAMTAIIMTALLLGVAYGKLEQKNDSHESYLKQDQQIQVK